MLFSFIVPVYNTSKYIDQCMESLLRQKGADYEILLIDDGSTDTSGEICDSYALNHPDTVRVIHKKNEGPFLTRRLGFFESKGDWIVCVDSDDYIDDDYLFTISSVIEKSDCDVVMYNYCYFDDNAKISRSNLQINDNTVFDQNTKIQLYKMRLLSNEINMMWLRVIKRSLIDFGGDYSKTSIRNLCDDAVQILPILTKSQRTIYIDKSLYYYRKGHEGSITSLPSFDNWKSIFESFLITEEYLDIWKIESDLRSQFYTKTIEELSNFLRWVVTVDQTDLPKALSELIHDIHMNPAFDRCMKMYNGTYSSTSYLKFSVPRIMKYVKKEDVKGMKKYLAFEKKVLSVIK